MFPPLVHKSPGAKPAHNCCPTPLASAGRDLKSVAGTLGGWPVRVATTHLESPTSWDNTFSAQRVAQCKQSLAVLDRAPEGDVLVAGDMVSLPAFVNSNALPCSRSCPVSQCIAAVELHPHCGWHACRTGTLMMARRPFPAGGATPGCTCTTAIPG